MSNLFSSMEEAAAEREAIMAADGIEFDEEERHRCEVSWVIRVFYPNAESAKAYFDNVENKRNKEAAEKLRADCRVAWAKHRTDLIGQA